MWAATAYPSFDAERRELRASEKEPPVLADSLFSPLQHTNTYLHVIQPQEEKLGSAVVASTQLPTRLQKRRASDALVDLQNSKRAKSAVKNLLTQSCPHFSNSKDGKRLPSTSHCGFNLITSTTVSFCFEDFCEVLPHLKFFNNLLRGIDVKFPSSQVWQF